MPRIIPIRDLKDTEAISQMCGESTEPIFIMENGYGKMVIISTEAYTQKMFMADAYAKLAEAEANVAEGNACDTRAGLAALREKYGSCS